jgi:uncharacterized membrane protein YgaE (UPF0421/DUF939 family)
MQLIKKKWLPELSYVLKCLSGVSICYILYIAFPNYPFFWAIISVVLAISPDNSNQQAYDRMKANLLGCAVGMGLYFLHLPPLLTLCLGVFLVIFIGTALKIPTALRPALAALIIVTIREQAGRQWFLPIERVICVVIGCVVALLLSLLFNLLSPKRLVQGPVVIPVDEDQQPDKKGGMQ